MFKQIETERLIIRPIELQDAQACYGILSDERVVNMNAALSLVKTLEESVQFIKTLQERYQNEKAGWYAVVAKNTNVMIGLCGFEEFNPNFHNAELGYAFAYSYWGKGYATEASKAILDFGFNHMNLNRAYATVDPTNNGSIRVLEKLGMKLEGYLRQAVFHNNQFIDRKIYAILKDDWIGKR